MHKSPRVCLALFLGLFACDSTSTFPQSPSTPDERCDTTSSYPCQHATEDSITDTAGTPGDTPTVTIKRLSLLPTSEGSGEYVYLSSPTYYQQGRGIEVIHGRDTLDGGKHSFSAWVSVFFYGPLTCSPTYTDSGCATELQSVKRILDSSAAPPSSFSLLRPSDTIIGIRISGKPATFVRSIWRSGRLGSERIDIVDSAAGAVYEKHASWSSASSSTTTFRRLRWNQTEFDSTEIDRVRDSIVQSLAAP